MPETSLRELIDRGEGERIEFKTASNGVHDDTFETVCSFGNHRGGDILLGVNDHGRVVGMPRDTVDAVLEDIRNRCASLDVFSTTISVEIEVVELHRRLVVRIHVEPNSRRVAYKGVSYVRWGESDYKGGGR